MASYVTLINWTDAGVAEFRDTVKRAEQATSLIESLGGKMIEILWTLGAYDLVAITEFPDDETGTAAALALSSQGKVRTTTLRAFNADEMREVIGKLG